MENAFSFEEVGVFFDLLQFTVFVINIHNCQIY